MPAAAELWSAEQVLPRLRSDLVISTQQYRRRTSYVVKDPIALRYYRIGQQELFLASLLDGERTLAQVTERLQEEFPAEDLDQTVVQQMLSALAEMSFLKLPAEFGERLFTLRLARRRAGKSRQLAMAIVGGLMYLRAALFDPDRFLLKLEKRVRFLWGQPVRYALLALLAVSLSLVIWHRQALQANLSSFLTLHNLFWLWTSLVGVKIIHEFGHGLACKHYGGEVHEMGVMLILLTPFLFCNATDSWMFRNKWDKIAVNTAGIFVELVLACLATLVWAATQPGLLNQLAFNVMMVCSVSTVVFNANPLMRFDGYYVLADWIEIPNLRDRARQQILGGFLRWLGVETQGLRVVGWQGVLMVLFGVASYLYMFWVITRLFRIVGGQLEPYGLAAIGRGSILLTYVFAIGFPLVAIVKRLWPTLRDSPSRLFTGRTRQIIIGFLLALLVLAVLPWPRAVTSSCVLDGANRTVVRIRSPGFVREVLAKEGQKVQAGEVLARLENRDLAKGLQDAESQLQVLELRKQSAAAQGNMSVLALLNAEATSWQAITARRRQDIDALVVRAPTAGVVLTADLAVERGTYAVAGNPFCEILPAGQINVVVPLTEPQVGLVRQGQRVEFRVYSLPARRFEGVVARVLTAPTSQLSSPALAARFGGEIPTRMDAGGIERPAQVIYQVDLQINNPGNFLRPGLSGRAKISCGRTTPLRAIVAYLGNLLDLDLRF